MSETFPNVRARMRISQHAPALARRDDELEIWLSGSRFRVRDGGGREPGELLGEVQAARGLGVPVRTMEGIMDQRAAARRPPPGATEIYGDLATGEGWVYLAGAARRAKPAAELVPLATQVLAAGRTEGLTRLGDVTRLGRTAAQHAGLVDVTTDGHAYRNQVVRVVAAPYLLLDDTRDAGNHDHFFVREVLELEEGVVTDGDLTPPP